MSPTVLAVVLLAALLHALWNAVVKGAGDRTLTMGLICLGHMIPALALAPFLPLPDAAAWPYILASTVIHWGYYALLVLAYRLGDLSLVYPIARGSAPLLIALGAQVFVGERLSALTWGGIALVSFGIFLLTLQARGGRLPVRGVIAALLVALTVASYSLVDGIGVRIPEVALSYIVWLFVLEGFFAFGALWLRRDVLRVAAPGVLVVGVMGGMISALAYALALWAKTQAPIGMVSALRETSVIIAALIGVVWFRERPMALRLVAAAVVCCGIAVLAQA